MTLWADLHEKARRHTGEGTAADNGEVARERPSVRPEDVATIHDLIRAGAEVRWLWKGWIQTGVLTALAATGGTGKTRFCADLLRRIRHGLPWPDGSPMTLPADSKALWVVSDNHHDEMVTLSRDFDIVDAIYLNAMKTDPYGGVSLEGPEDYEMLAARIQAVRPLFTVIDTVGNATDRNLSRQEDAKAFYQPLQVIARESKAALLCLTHLNAAGQFLGRRVQEKVRTAIRMDQYEGEARRRLEIRKTNAVYPPPLGVTMGDGGNEYDATPPEPPEQEPGKRAVPAKLQEAVDWLREKLEVGPLRIKTAIDSAKLKGMAVGTIYRARDLLQAEEFESQGYKWWRLTEEPLPD
jgi:hypothetical protein